MKANIDRAYAIVTACMILMIVYGSLYPFEFSVPPAGPGPVQVLLASWAEKPGRGDFIANILFYSPLGFFGTLALSHRARALLRFPAVLVLGTLLSIGMELTQYYEPARVTAATDVYANALGTGLGAVLGNLIGNDLRWSFLVQIRLHRIPALLLLAWIGYRLYPFVPTIDLHKYWTALKPILLNPRLSQYDLFRHTAVWLTVYSLVARLGERLWPWLLLPLFAAAVLISEVVVVSGMLSLPQVTGAVAAYLIWALFGRWSRAYLAINILLLTIAILALRLAPFQFTTHPVPFGWIPFRSFMYGSIRVDVLSFLEKFFLYGSLIWLLTDARIRYPTAGCLVAAMLFATSYAERYLPDRSAEITDSVMAVTICAIFALLAGNDARFGRQEAQAHAGSMRDRPN